MASPSAPHHNPEHQSVEAAVNEGQAISPPSEESSAKSVFVNSQPKREDQVQNAVKFLSDPRIRGSQVVHRRNFLEQKGLTKEEIDEAFRRIPDPSPAVISGQNGTYQDAQSAPMTNIQTQTQAQLMQPTTARRFHWSYAVLATGFLTIFGTGTTILFQKAVIPAFKSWIHWVVFDQEDDLRIKTSGKPNLAEEAAAAAKAAAAAAIDVTKACEKLLTTKIEEKRCFVDFQSLLNEQLEETKTLMNAIKRLEGQAYGDERHFYRQEYLNDHVARSMKPQINGKREFNIQSVRSLSSPALPEPSRSNPNMKILAMARRGEIPPYIRDIEDLVMNSNKPVSNPTMVRRAKPQATSEDATYMVHKNVAASQSNDSSVPWWQQPFDRIAETKNSNVPKTISASNGMVGNGNQIPRRWVPPQPPPVSLPEAAAAIRQTKSIPKNVDLRSDDTVQRTRSLDRLQRITDMSESGGRSEMNGESGSSEGNLKEIQEEQVA